MRKHIIENMDTEGICLKTDINRAHQPGVRHQCGQLNVNLRQVPAQVND